MVMTRLRITSSMVKISRRFPAVVMDIVVAALAVGTALKKLQVVMVVQ